MGCLEKAAFLFACCTATAVLVVSFEISTQQWGLYVTALCVNVSACLEAERYNPVTACP
jgi:hypothetical protein